MGPYTTEGTTRLRIDHFHPASLVVSTGSLCFPRSLPVPSVVGSGSVLILFPLPSPSPTERALRGEWSGDGNGKERNRGPAVRSLRSFISLFVRPSVA